MMKRIRSRKPAWAFGILALLAWFAFSAPIASANGHSMASITVRVDGPNGVPIDGAKVTATNEATKQAVAMFTDASGRCVLGPLAPGEYVVESSAKSFVTRDLRVHLKPGKRARAHARLRSTAQKPKSRWLQ